MAKVKAVLFGGDKSPKAGKYLMKGQKGWTASRDRAHVFDSKSEAERAKKAAAIDGIRVEVLA